MWVMGRKKELTEEEKVSMLRMLGSEVDKMFQSQRFVCQSTVATGEGSLIELLFPHPHQKSRFG